MTSKHNSLIIIEGISGAGKTTLQDVLKNFYSDSYHYLPNQADYELYRKLVEKKRIEAVPPSDEEQLRYGTVFINLETSIKAAQVRVLQASRSVMMSRDWSSNLAFNYALSKNRSNSIYLEIERRIFALLDEGKLIVPDLRLILSVDPEISIERQKVRGRIMHALNYDLKFLQNQNDYLVGLCTDKKYGVSVVIDANQSIDCVRDMAMNLISGCL